MLFKQFPLKPFGSFLPFSLGPRQLKKRSRTPAHYFHILHPMGPRGGETSETGNYCFFCAGEKLKSDLQVERVILSSTKKGLEKRREKFLFSSSGEKKVHYLTP